MTAPHQGHASKALALDHRASLTWLFAITFACLIRVGSWDSAEIHAFFRKSHCFLLRTDDEKKALLVEQPLSSCHYLGCSIHAMRDDELQSMRGVRASADCTTLFWSWHM